MRIKQNLPFMAAVFLMLLSFGTAKAQTQTTNPVFAFRNACEACAPSISAIQSYDFPFNCLRKGFGITHGGNTFGDGQCAVVAIIWATSDASCNISTTGPADGNPKITFSEPGVYEVCARVRRWWDRNNNGIQEEGETCTSDQYCIEIEVCR